MAQTPTDLDKARLEREMAVHREISLDVIRSTPSFATRTPKGQKDPGHLKWDPKNSNEETSAQNLHALAKSDDNIGIHLFGEMVDVDIDTENEWIQVALDHFLPHTPHIWGRPSRPRTHRLYQLSLPVGNREFQVGQYSFLKAIASHPRLKLELRGGRQESGQYTLMPGSLHPSGEYYVWDDTKSARMTPVIRPEHEIVKAVRMACVAALIAPHWTEGVRNTLSMALSGFLYKAAKYGEELGYDLFVRFDRSDAEALIRGICEISGDDAEDIPSRLRTLEQTWEKGDAGGQIRGATTISRLTEEKDIVALLYALLVDAAGLVEFEKFAEDFAFWTNEAKIIDIKSMKEAGATAIMSPDQFRLSYAHRRIELPQTGKVASLPSMFLGSDHITRVIAMDYNPSEPQIFERATNKFVLNNWTGYAIEPAEGTSEEEVLPFLNYLHEIVANNDSHNYNWVLQWVADIFQNPARKPGTALVLVGKPGAGKSILGEMFIRPIIGYRHSAVLADISNLLQNFNMDTAFKQFIQCDEALNTRQKSHAHKLKARITDEMARVEPKNVNAFNVPDYARYMFTSNEIFDAVAIVDGQDDRRYTVLEVNDKYSASHANTTVQQKHEYFKNLADWATVENLAKLHAYLLTVDVDKSFITRPLHTRARVDTIRASAQGIDAWLAELVVHDNPFTAFPRRTEDWWSIRMDSRKAPQRTMVSWPHYVSYTGLVASYEEYRKRNRFAPPMNERDLKQHLTRHNLVSASDKGVRLRIKEEFGYDGECRERRVKVWPMPTKQRLRHYLETKLGQSFEDEENVEDLEETTETGPNKTMEF